MTYIILRELFWLSKKHVIYFTRLIMPASFSLCVLTGPPF